MIVPSPSVVLRQLLMLCLLLSVASVSIAEESWQELDWLELMPEEDLRLLESLPEVEHEEMAPRRCRTRSSPAGWCRKWTAPGRGSPDLWCP